MGNNSLQNSFIRIIHEDKSNATKKDINLQYY